MPGQAAFWRTRVLTLLTAATVIMSIAERKSDHRETGRSRPVLPADFRRRVSTLTVEVDKRVKAIQAVEVQ